MSMSFSSAPHIEGAHAGAHPSHAPNAALLVDFDNVTMGMRSDLSKELKTLLSSDVIRGKVTVQRAYADWRRYPQYIVPLSEASIDLIFAPAYGSSKKNATDIRMAIDGIELVFTRPEIGTYILLTGDSDFSSLVLKLKEYGKYVIGVGIQESSSDILVQNCDEYYSYTSLSGLRKTDDSGPSPTDPWVLVEKATEQMGRRGDVMRSDRLKQVMLEIDPGFDEKSFGFNKFSRFVSEASQKGLIDIRRMENGQYEILSRGSKKPEEQKNGGRSRDGRKGDRGRGGRERNRTEPAASPSSPSSSATSGASNESLSSAYALLRKAISELLEDQDADSVRDSDVKRRMLALKQGFDEAEFGFSK
ncbi:MAG: NYN domain-containing protein, partial [Gemmatimonadota bacterium]